MFEDVLANMNDETLGGLERKDQLGDLDFGAVIPSLVKIRTLLKGLAAQDPDDIYPALRSESEAHGTSVLNLIQRMRDFNLSIPNANDIHRDIATSVRAELDWFLQVVRPQIRVGETDIAELQLRLSAAVASAEQKEKELQTALSSVRQGTGVAGASKLSSFYQTEAIAHEEAANDFFKLAAAALAITLGLSVAFLVIWPIQVAPESSTQWFDWLRGLLPRAFALGIGAYVVAFGARNYRINKHLQVVNTQRRNALDTYGLFVESLAEGSARDLATGELLRAVWDPGDSGYLGATDHTVFETQPSIASVLQRPPQ